MLTDVGAHAAQESRHRRFSVGSNCSQRVQVFGLTQIGRPRLFPCFSLFGFGRAMQPARAHVVPFRAQLAILCALCGPSEPRNATDSDGTARAGAPNQAQPARPQHPPPHLIPCSLWPHAVILHRAGRKRVLSEMSRGRPIAAPSSLGPRLNGGAQTARHERLGTARLPSLSLCCRLKRLVFTLS